MRLCTIVVGWYRRWNNEGEPIDPIVREIKVIVRTEETDLIELRKIVAEQMGYSYPDEIDYRYFDIEWIGL